MFTDNVIKFTLILYLSRQNTVN